MKLKTEQKKIIDTYANYFAYYIQDILDDIADGGRFNFSKTEKDFNKQLLAFIEELE